MTDRELMQDALDALNNFDKGNHGMRWQVPIIKALRARLAQPEPAECDGGQCGIGGYCKECPKTKPEPEPEKSQDKPCVEDDGCPTEKAVLQRFWREHQAQPEPAECDGGQCGIGGYCKQCPKTRPEQEPVAWGVPNTRPAEKAQFMMLLHSADGCQYPDQLVPLYTAPPQREWVGLTDDELHALHFELKVQTMGGINTLGMYRILEAKLKEKNG